MIDVEHERGRTGGAGFTDAVSIDFCDGERELFGFVRVAREPDAGTASALALLFAGGAQVAAVMLDSAPDPGDWQSVELGGVRLETVAPLERWRVSMETAAGGFEVEAVALSPPLALEPPDGAGADGEQGLRYEQLCRVTGSATTGGVGGSSPAVRGLGRRAHCWGALEAAGLERWRSLYAASDEGRAVVVTSARPHGARGHGDERRSAALLTPEAAPERFDEVLLSTVYRRDGMPAKAGAELYQGDDDLPLRLSGAAVCEAQQVLARVRLGVSFFRWRVEGVEAFGSYESVAPA